jgi:hypothetical protein
MSWPKTGGERPRTDAERHIALLDKFQEWLEIAERLSAELKCGETTETYQDALACYDNARDAAKDLLEEMDR